MSLKKFKFFHNNKKLSTNALNKIKKKEEISNKKH